jgi:hypothetical protein
MNFAKEVDVYGSHDNIHWDFVQKDILYAVGDQSKLTIDFTQPQKFTHYRLRLANNLEQISFDSVHLIYSIEAIEETYFIEYLVPAFHIESRDRRTVIHIEGLRNLRLCDITIHTDSMFRRTAGTPHGIRKEIYNLSFDGTSYADTTIPLNRRLSEADTYRLTIEDADDRPIRINSITVRYYADDLVFEGNAGESFTLVFGRDPARAAPVYDIARYKNEILAGAVDRAVISEIHFTGVPQERDYTLIFNVVIIAVTLLLGTVILLKLKKK